MKELIVENSQNYEVISLQFAEHTLYNVRSKKYGRVFLAVEVAREEISLQLQSQQVSINIEEQDINNIEIFIQYILVVLIEQYQD